MLIFIDMTKYKIIEPTWYNLFGILLTNSFTIKGTIIGLNTQN